MSGKPITIIEQGNQTEVDAAVDGGKVRVAAADVERALGWQLKPEGLCKGATCVPVRNPVALSDERGIDLAMLADALGLPAVVDADNGVAAFAGAATDRAAALASLEAPDFELPDLGGRTHRLSDFRGKKVLLAAWASW